MNLLDIHSINENAPYHVFESTRPNYYGFVSATGVEFSVGFDKDDLLTVNSYQLIITNVNHRSSPRDRRVRDTILAIIDEFFQRNNVTMLYICDTGDGKQAMRSRLFSYWFSSFVNKSKYTLLQSSIKDDEGIDNFFAIITRNDNPEVMKVMREFSETIHLFSNKPR